MIPVQFVSSGSIVQGTLFGSVSHSPIATVIFLQGFPRIEGDELIADKASLDHERLAPSLRDRDILLIGGWQDAVVPVAEHIHPFYHALVQSGARQARLVTFEDDHEFPGSRDQLVATLLDWITAREQKHP